MNTRFLTGTNNLKYLCIINKQAKTVHRSLRRENPRGEGSNKKSFIGWIMCIAFEGKSAFTIFS